jgi:PAS domain S-box-containing protein
MNALANASPPTLLLLLPAAASVQAKAIQPLDRWWQTGWLYVVVGALGCGLIALIYLAKLRQRQTEQTLAARLQASEARFARIFRTSPVAMILLRTKSGHIVDINPAWSQLVGYSAEEAIGRTTIELDVVDEAARQYLVSNLSDQRSVRNLETTIRTRTNQPLQVLISTELFDIDGEPGRLATIIDITERKQAEEKSRTAAEHFAIVFHRSPVPMSLVRMADNVYLEANDSFLRLVECTRDEVIGHTSLELNLIDVEDQAKNIRVFNQPNGPSHIEVRGRTKSGRLLTVLVSSEKTELAGEVCWITTMLDISERKQIEDALQEREHFLSRILSTSPAIVYIYDFEIQANVYATRLRRQRQHRLQLQRRLRRQHRLQRRRQRQLQLLRRERPAW